MWTMPIKRRKCILITRRSVQYFWQNHFHIRRKTSLILAEVYTEFKWLIRVSKVKIKNFRIHTHSGQLDLGNKNYCQQFVRVVTLYTMLFIKWKHWNLFHFGKHTKNVFIMSKEYPTIWNFFNVYSSRFGFQLPVARYLYLFIFMFNGIIVDLILSRRFNIECRSHWLVKSHLIPIFAVQLLHFRE